MDLIVCLSMSATVIVIVAVNDLKVIKINIFVRQNYLLNPAEYIRSHYSQYVCIIVNMDYDSKLKKHRSFSTF